MPTYESQPSRCVLCPNRLDCPILYTQDAWKCPAPEIQKELAELKIK